MDIALLLVVNCKSDIIIEKTDIIIKDMTQLLFIYSDM